MKRETKVIREFEQRCPICGSMQEIAWRGHVNYKEKAQVMPPMFGYSFCNCHNIFFTDYRNISKDMMYNDYYSQRYNNELLRDN